MSSEAASKPGSASLKQPEQLRPRLVPAYIDYWTLEITPAALEAQYQQRHESLWLPWLAGERLLGVVTAAATVWKLVSSGEPACLECQLFASLVVLRASLNLAAVVTAVLPAWRRVSFRFVILLELVLVLLHTQYAFCLRKAEESFQMQGEDEELGWPSEVRLFLLYWLMRFWLRCSFLFKHMLLAMLWNSAAVALLLAFRMPAASVALAAGRLVMTVLCTALSYRFELRKRLKLLATLEAASVPASQQAMRRSAMAALQRALEQAERRERAREEASRVAASARWDAAAAILQGGNAAWAAPSAPPQLLHIHLPGLHPLDLPPQFRSAVQQKLSQQRLCILDSYIAEGSVWLNLVLDAQDAAALDLGELLRGLQKSSVGQQFRDAGVSMQIGRQLWTCRPGSSGEKEACSWVMQRVAVPALLRLDSHILPMDQSTSLRVALRMPAGPAAARGGFFLILYCAGRCLKLPISKHSSDATYLVEQQLHFDSGAAASTPLQALLLQASDGTAFSAATPIFTCSCPKLRAELLTVEECLPRSLLPAQRSCCSYDSVLWGLWDMASYSLRGQPNPHGCPATAQEAGAPARLQRRVRRSCASLVVLAVSLGLPHLLQHVLRSSRSAFKRGAADAPARTACSRSTAVLLPVGLTVGARSGAGDEGAALAALLEAAGRAAHTHRPTSILHLAVLSGCVQAVLALQEEAAAVGMLLNWQVACDLPVEAHGGGHSPRTSRVSALQLAALQLPASAEICQRALRSGGAGATAWREVVAELQAACHPAAASAQALLSPPASAPPCQPWLQRQRLLLIRHGQAVGGWPRAGKVRTHGNHWMLLCCQLLLLAAAAACYCGLRQYLQPATLVFRAIVCLTALLLRLTVTVGPALAPVLNLTTQVLLMCPQGQLREAAENDVAPALKAVMRMAVIHVSARLIAPLTFRMQVLSSLISLACRSVSFLDVAEATDAQFFSFRSDAACHAAWLTLHWLLEAGA